MYNENNTDTTANEEEFASAPVATQSNLPLIITLVALITYFGFQTVSLLAERNNLGLIKNSQETALQEAQKTQAQFRTIVTKTGELADKGHGGAKMVIGGLQRQGMGMAGPTKAPETIPDKAEAKPAK